MTRPGDFDRHTLEFAAALTPEEDGSEEVTLSLLNGTTTSATYELADDTSDTISVHDDQGTLVVVNQVQDASVDEDGCFKIERIDNLTYQIAFRPDPSCTGSLPSAGGRHWFVMMKTNMLSCVAGLAIGGVVVFVTHTCPPTSTLSRTTDDSILAQQATTDQLLVLLAGSIHQGEWFSDMGRTYVQALSQRPAHPESIRFMMRHLTCRVESEQRGGDRPCAQALTRLGSTAAPQLLHYVAESPQELSDEHIEETFRLLLTWFPDSAELMRYCESLVDKYVKDPIVPSNRARLVHLIRRDLER